MSNPVTWQIRLSSRTDVDPPLLQALVDAAGWCSPALLHRAEARQPVQPALYSTLQTKECDIRTS